MCALMNGKAFCCSLLNPQNISKNCLLPEGCSHSRELSDGLIHISHLYLLPISEPAGLSPKDAVCHEFSLKCIWGIFQSAWESQRIKGKSRVTDFEGSFQNDFFAYLIYCQFLSVCLENPSDGGFPSPPLFFGGGLAVFSSMRGICQRCAEPLRFL